MISVGLRLYTSHVGYGCLGLICLSPFFSVFLRPSPSVAVGVCPSRRCTAGAHMNVLLLDVVRDAVVV